MTVTDLHRDHRRTDPHAMGVAVDLTQYRVLKVWAEMFNDAQEHRIRIANRVHRAPVFPDVFANELAAAEQSEHRIRLAMRRQYRKTAPAGVIAWAKAAPGIGKSDQPDALARLLGHLGHPRIATPSHWEGKGSERKLIPDEPFERTVGELWQYAGHGAPGRLQKGMSADELAALGSPMLKKLVWLLASCAIKQPGRTINQEPTVVADATSPPAAGDPPPSVQPTAKGDAAGDVLGTDQRIRDTHGVGVGADPSATPPKAVPTPKPDAAVWPYRLVYEQRRAETADRVHAEPCVRCGPSGKPAEAGSPWSAAHQHADAIRIVGKEILRDLWLAAEVAS